MSLRLGETVIAGSLDLNGIKQAIYDGIFPVNNVQFGFTAPGVPAGVNATWVDVSNQYNNRYFKVDATYAAGTEQAESLPTPTVSINSAGDHNHDRGTMNITGLLRTAPSADSNVGDTMAIKHASGAFYNAGNAGSGSQRIYDINASYSRDTNVSTIGFNAASNWTGVTSTGGSHSHTATVSGGPYSGSAAVKPLTITIKVWKRTA